MKKIFLKYNGIAAVIGVMAAICCFCSCKQETIEDKAEREAREYTRKYCPTPIINSTRTDSVVYDKRKNVYVYYISFAGDLDNQEIINEHKAEIMQILQSTIRESTALKPYVDAGFRFEYVCHSVSNPKLILFQTKV